MLTNAVIGGCAFALYLTVVFLQINPGFGLAWLPGLAATVVLSYGVHAAAAFYALAVLRQLMATEVLSPGWISFRFLVWLLALATTAGAVLMWANLRSFAAVLAPDAGRRMTGGAVALTACAAVCLVLVGVHRWSRGRTTRAGAAVLGVTLVVSLAVPLTLRGPGDVAPPPGTLPAIPVEPASPAGDARVTILAFEGASLDIIVPAAADGRLPHFARILETGASLHVASLRPTQPAAVWTTAATGKLPSKHGIRSAAVYWPLASRDSLEVLPDYCFAHALVRFGFLRSRGHTSHSLAAWPLWTILSTQGVSAGVVNWSVTHPARRVLGYLVSDRFERWQESSIELEGSDAVWPREAVDAAVAAASIPTAAGVPLPAARARDAGDPAISSCDADLAFERIAADLQRGWPTRLRAVRYECLDAVGHYFLRYTMPSAFDDVSEEELRRSGGVLMGQYVAADAIVGRELAALRPGDLLLVVSGFGMEPLDPGKRLLERAFGNPDLSGSHERAPDGFLMAFGTAVRPGHYPRASIADLAPTVLYYFGLPVGRDMDGFARTDLFQRALTDTRPITFIPTYER
jgi:hypothetical protein